MSLFYIFFFFIQAKNIFFLFFFFQAEDGIRDHCVTGVQTCALPICLAEAFAEYLHARVRREWGYGATEVLTTDDLINEKYRGIRPAFGYPACPDHTEKVKLFDLLAAERVGIKLTESCAMTPAASVSGIYLSHPQARYFMLGRIGQDQLEDYARRKAQSVDVTRRWIQEHVDDRDAVPAVSGG